MAYELKEGFGSLFKNDKDGNEARPDYTGNCMVNGKEMRIAAWIKDGQKGKFMSLKLSEPQEQSNEPKKYQEPDEDPLEDSIPF